MDQDDAAQRPPGDGDDGPTVLVDSEADGTIATLTLNRPRVRNALSMLMARELTDAISTLATRRDLRVVVVTGAGDRAFCAGADLTERRSMTPAELSSHTDALNTAADALAALPVPTLAAIRGYALAGGAELAIACDMRIAAEDAVLGYPEVLVGVFPGAGGVVRLPRLVGAGAARDLLFTGRQVSAAEAYRLGLVDRLVPPEDLPTTVRELASQIAANAPLAIRAVKRALSETSGLPAADAHRIAATHRRPLDATADYLEGLHAFAERRSPRFRGE